MEILAPEQARKQRVEKARLENEARRASYDSAATIVPAEFTFTETQYEPPQDLAIEELSEELSKLHEDDLFTGLAKQYRKTRVSHGWYRRDATTLVAFVDYIIEHYKDERVSKNRDGKPTVKDVFFAIGWNYEAARKMRQRYRTAMAALPDYAPTPKPKQLSDGSTVQQEGDNTQYVVLGRPQPGGVEIVPEGASSLADAKTVSVEVVSRVSVKKIKANDLIRDDNGKEYRYIGGGVLKRINTPAIAEKRDREAAAIAKAREDRTTGLAEEQRRKAELRKAQAAQRDIERIAEAKAKQEAEAKKKAEKKVKETAAAAKKAAKNAKQRAEDEAKAKAAAAATDAVVTQLAPYGTDENGKLDFLGTQDADGEEVQQ